MKVLFAVLIFLPLSAFADSNIESDFAELTGDFIVESCDDKDIKLGTEWPWSICSGMAKIKISTEAREGVFAAVLKYEVEADQGALIATGTHLLAITGEPKISCSSNKGSKRLEVTCHSTEGKEGMIKTIVELVDPNQLKVQHDMIGPEFGDRAFNLMVKRSSGVNEAGIRDFLTPKGWRE